MRLSIATRILLLLATVVAASLIAELSTAAQCGMCRASLAGSNNAFFIRNFNIGVLVLLVPPVAIFCSLFVALRRCNLQRSDETDVGGSGTEKIV